MLAVINDIHAVTELKVKARPASSYFCDVDYKQIEVKPTVEVNLNKVDPGIELLRNIVKIANSHGYSVDFFNGSPFIGNYRTELREEGFLV